MEILGEYWWVLAVVAGLILLPYVFGPILIRFTLTQSSEPVLTEFPPDHPDLPREVQDHFRRVTAALQPHGFEEVMAVALPEQSPTVKPLVLMYLNRQNKDAAIAACFYAKTPEGTKLQTAYVEIVTRFRDGQVVQSNNSDQMSAFPIRPNFISTQFAMVANPGRLYKLHSYIAEQTGNTSGKVLRADEDFRGDVKAYLQFALIEELDAASDAGYMYKSQSEPLYRPTWVGSFIMVWQELPPFKQLRRKRRERAARRIIAAMER